MKAEALLTSIGVYLSILSFTNKILGEEGQAAYQHKHFFALEYIVDLSHVQVKFKGCHQLLPTVVHFVLAIFVD